MQKHRSHIIIIAVLLALCAYERGLRIGDMSEIPASQRPASIIVTAGR